MNSHENLVFLFARVSTIVFLIFGLTTFTTLYGWMHPALWGVQILAFVVFEGGLYLVRGSRPRVDMAVALAMWTSVGVWMSLEHLSILVAVIVALRALPDGWPLRILSLFLVSGIGVLTKLADINFWSSAPPKLWLHHLFVTSCVFNMLLVLARVSLPATEGFLRKK